MESIKNTFSSINPFSKTKTSMEKINDDVSERLSNVKNTFSSTIDNISNIPEKSNTQKIMDKFSLTPPTVEQIKQSVTPIKKSNSFSWGIRFILLFIIIALLAVNSYKYLAKGEHVFLRNVIDAILGVLDTIKDFIENTLKGTKIGGNIIVKSVIDFINLIKSMFLSLKKNENVYIKQSKKKKKEKKEVVVNNNGNKVGKSVNNNKKKKKKPGNDSSDSKIQQKEGGYCYIGYQTPHNACIKVDDVTKCMSGRVFKTKNKCDSYIPN